MSRWFSKISADRQNQQLIVDAIEFFDNELDEARKEVNETGRIESVSARLPGIVEYRYAQWQEVEAILELLNIDLRKIRGARYKHYLESNNRVLSSRDAEKYADADQAVLDISELINFVSFIRNKYIGILKALESKSFTINGIIKIKAAGMEEVWMPDQYQ